jgi:hypothetical protein
VSVGQNAQWIWSIRLTEIRTVGQIAQWIWSIRLTEIRAVGQTEIRTVGCLRCVVEETIMTRQVMQLCLRQRDPDSMYSIVCLTRYLIRLFYVENRI